MIGMRYDHHDVLGRFVIKLSLWRHKTVTDSSFWPNIVLETKVTQVTLKKAVGVRFKKFSGKVSNCLELWYFSCRDAPFHL